MGVKVCWVVSWVSRCVGQYHGCVKKPPPPLSVSAQFVPGTHLLFSCGKDHTVKCWDADTFNHIMTLEVGCVIL